MRRNKVIIVHNDMIVFIEHWKELTNKLLGIKKRKSLARYRYKCINNSFTLFTSNHKLENFIFERHHWIVTKTLTNLEINLTKDT